MEWWQAEENDVLADPVMANARQAAYYSVFYCTAEGRKVLADLKRLFGDGCWAKAQKIGLSADEFLCYSSVIGKIRANAGADDEMAIIVAESQVARGRTGQVPTPQMKPKEETNLLED